MHTNMNHDQDCLPPCPPPPPPPPPTPPGEVLCIRTNKVYDWIVNEGSFELTIPSLTQDIPAALSINDCSDITFTCDVRIPDADDPVEPFEEVNREVRDFIINGESVQLEILTIRKNFYVQIIAAYNGTTFEVGVETLFTRCEQVILYAPAGTTINLSYTNTSCFVCVSQCEINEEGGVDLLQLDNITIFVSLCQSIQSFFLVTLEIEAEFCGPRAELPFPPCPAPTRPQQCPLLFPNN